MDMKPWMVAFALVVLLLSCAPQSPETSEGPRLFRSAAELEEFLKENVQQGGMYGGDVMMMRAGVAEAAAAPTAGGEKTADFSTTNVQVKGVDEADIVKSDGEFLYIVSGQKVVIVKAYPAEEMETVKTISLDFSPEELYINGDRLVILGNGWRKGEGDDPRMAASGVSAEMSMRIAPDFWPQGTQVARMLVYDLSSRSSPEKVRDIAADGYYFDSRMIGDFVYVISQESLWYQPGPIPLPAVRENGVTREIPATDIAYFPIPDQSYTYTNVLSVSLDRDSRPIESHVYMLGSAQSLFVSQEGIYIVYQRYLPYWTVQQRQVDAMMEVLPSSVQSEMQKADALKIAAYKKEQLKLDIIEEHVNSLDAEEQQALQEKLQKRMEEIEREVAREQEQTHIHKLSIADGDVEYVGKGRVPGRVLNQFSMDEFDGYFRIATTSGQSWDGTSSNNLYVLDGELEVVGSVEDLAPGESIYSVRFMGERAYMVTFKKVDPLFVIGLSDPTNPEVLGKLKIPGYSDYLHPYDEDHIIGIGKEAIEAEEGDFAWYQGVKLALFDVSDVEVPKELDKVELGDRGTDSEALHEHKAFLFSREKSLLVLPVLLAQINPEQYSGRVPLHAWGDYVFQGAYVYQLDLDGFKLRGRVTHVADDSLEKSGYYYGSDYSIRRAMYIGDVLYTLSGSEVQAHDLETLEFIESVKLPVQRYDEPVVMEG